MSILGWKISLDGEIPKGSRKNLNLPHGVLLKVSSLLLSVSSGMIQKPEFASKEENTDAPSN